MRIQNSVCLLLTCVFVSCVPQGQIPNEENLAQRSVLNMEMGGSQGDTTLPSSPPSSLETRVDAIVEGLFVPWDIVFTAPNRFLVTERNGTIRAVVDNVLQNTPLVEFTDLFERGETGLLDMELHPEYAENAFVYVSLVTEKQSGPVLRIERLRDEGDRLVRDKVIMDDIPTGQYHAGSRLLFDQSGYLLVSTGDGTTGANAQSDAHLAGKILRMTDEGEEVPGNESIVLMKGLRNPQGIALLDENTFFLTEHGPSGFDGLPGGDELNIGGIGDNFGWPVVSHERTNPDMVSPAKVFTPAVAPASAMVYQGEMFPEWKGNVFVGLLKGEGIERVVLIKTPGKVNEKDSWSLQSSERVPGIDVGRVRAVVEAPDGSIYFTTSNRDGRGKIREGDDKVYRLSR